MRPERQAGDSSQRELHQYLFLMLLRHLVGDTVTAGIPAGVAERRCLHRPVIMTNTKCLSRRTKQKAVGCSLYKLIQGSVKMGEESRCHLSLDLHAVIVRALGGRRDLLNRWIPFLFSKLVWIPRCHLFLNLPAGIVRVWWNLVGSWIQCLFSKLVWMSSVWPLDKGSLHLVSHHPTHKQNSLWSTCILPIKASSAYPTESSFCSFPSCLALKVFFQYQRGAELRRIHCNNSKV